jgi:hypothetical protein
MPPSLRTFQCACYRRAVGPQQGEGRILPRVRIAREKLPEYRRAKQRAEQIALELSF